MISWKYELSDVKESWQEEQTWNINIYGEINTIKMIKIPG